MACKTYTLLFFLFFISIPFLEAQIDPLYQMDSIEIERGISGTTDFEPFFKIIHEAYDDDNRPTRSVVYEYISPTELVPNQRQQTEYNNQGNTTMFLMENWDSNQEDWVPVKQENSTYSNGRLTEFVKMMEFGGVLVNFRKWTYNYNGNGFETGKLLQEWNPDIEDWENLSRKMTTYNANGKIETQMTQSYVGGNWENRRLRTWTWNPDEMQPSVSLFQRWDNSNEEWVNDTRKTYGMGTNGLWSGSVVEKWDNNTQEWNNRMRETFTINSGFSTHEGENWADNAWQPYIQSSYTSSDNQNPAIVQRWDETGMQYDNFLRHRLTINNNLPQRRIGMQSWNEQSESWENKDYTRRVTYFWTEDQSTSTSALQIENKCLIPNPYYNGALISCDIPLSNQTLFLEVTNMLGQPLIKEQINDQVFPITTTLDQGMYIVRILDNHQVYHLEKIFVSQ